MIDLKELFEKHSDDEYLKFDRIENPRHPVPDICLFLMLDDICPSFTQRFPDKRTDIIGEHRTMRSGFLLTPKNSPLLLLKNKSLI
jgi:hypothetical protein